MTTQSAETVLRNNGFYFQQVYVKIVPLKRRKQIRMEFKLSVKEAFKLHVEEVTGHKPSGTVHHRLPIMFGGANHFFNLVVVEDNRVHKAVHEFINNQTEGLRMGRSMRIMWPVKSGLIWTATP